MKPSPSPRQVALIAETYRLLGDPTRLGVLLACMEAPTPVGDIAARVGVAPSLASHHLRLLKAARLVRGERRERQILYALDDDHIRHMLADMIDHVGCGERAETQAKSVRSDAAD